MIVHACVFAVVIVAAMVCYCQHAPCTLPGCTSCKKHGPDRG